MIQAPFTPEQVRSLNGFQQSGRYHPFTCTCGEHLMATEQGWICRDCDYTQNWAHEFMANNEWRNDIGA